MNAPRQLEEEILRWAADPERVDDVAAARAAVQRLLAALNDESVRAAEQRAEEWRAVE